MPPGKQSPAPAVAPAPAVQPAQDAPAQDAPNSLVLSLLAAQADVDLDDDVTDLIRAAAEATWAVFRNDPEGFDTHMDEVGGALGGLEAALAAADARDARLAKEGDALTDDDRAAMSDAKGERTAAYNRAFDPARGLGFWLWPTEYGDKQLVGMYGREGVLPRAQAGANGVAAWSTWADERDGALGTLLERAGRVDGWCEDAAAELPTEAPLVAAAMAAVLGAPPDLDEVIGREHQFLTEVMRDRMPGWFVDLHTKDMATLRMESEALDAGVTVDRLYELDEMIETFSTVDEQLLFAARNQTVVDDIHDRRLQELIALPIGERAYVFRKLRWNEDWEQLIQAADEDTMADLDVAATEAGMGYVMGEGMDDEYTEWDCAADMGRAVPGSILNVGYGMVTGVPIVGDVIDKFAGDFVDEKIDALNAATGLDDWMAEDQRVWGQTIGKVAGAIGTAGVAGVGAGSTSVLGSEIALSGTVRGVALGADVLNNGVRAVSGHSIVGDEISTTDQWLSGIGAVLGIGGAVAGNSVNAAKTGVQGADEVVEATSEAAGNASLASVMNDIVPGWGAATTAEDVAKAQSAFQEAVQGAGAAEDALKTSTTIEDLFAKAGVLIGSGGTLNGADAERK